MLKLIVLDGDFLQKLAERPGAKDVFFYSLDEGDVYSCLSRDGRAKDLAPGTIYVQNEGEKVSIPAMGKSTDRLRIIVQACLCRDNNPAGLNPIKAKGFVRAETGWAESEVQVLPVREEIFSRARGILETDVLAGKKVLIAGVGSGGSSIAVELAKAGVMHFFLMDHDRIEIGNVARHEAGVSDVGRYKTNVVAERIGEKNPYARVETFKKKVCPETMHMLHEIVREVDIIICATDNRDSRRLLNRHSIDGNKPCIFAGAFRRAHGGQIQFVRPRLSPCYQCFLMHLPDHDKDHEISSQEQARDISYSDRHAAIEPGLSSDISPISNMVVKLVIQELLKGTETTLASLNEDLVAPFFFWLNRRESGTQYEKLDPLEFNLSGIHILRWYGVNIERVPNCPVCGESEDPFS
jgi:molybdopterin/thiamine biosynthesis adenylyltransferase